jgi:hypothetical protein
MIEPAPLTPGSVRWLWPMREGMRKYLTVRRWQMHRFPDVCVVGTGRNRKRRVVRRWFRHVRFDAVDFFRKA